MTARILVADDDPMIRRIIERSLAAQPGLEIIASGNGSEAAALAESEKPDLMLLDLSMPGRDGFTVLRELRARPSTRLLPVIVVTGQSAEATRVNGLGLGADDFITKPFSPAELAARVRRLLERRQQDLGAHPLTGLPGSPDVEAEVTRRIRAGRPFALCHADIDRFKSFNDRYGFARGDQAIAMTAKLLEECARLSGAGAFVGHVGGDDFALVLEPLEAEIVLARAVELFDERAALLYDAEDRAKGAVRLKDRRGVMRRFALMTLSIGVATTESRPLAHYAEAVQIASEMKAFLKGDRRRRSSRFAFDRRAS